MNHLPSIGDHVRIVPSSDEMMDSRYVGHTGVVTHVAARELRIGESPTDPAIIVRFDGPVRLRNRDTSNEWNLPGFQTRDEDAFWAEELMPWM